MKGYIAAAAGAALLLFWSMPTLSSHLIPCDVSDPKFVCGLHNPEDIVHLPGTSWAVATSLNIDFVTLQVRGTGPLSAIDIRTRRVQQLYPAPESVSEWDRKAYPDCSAAPKLFASHGLNVQALDRNRFRLYVANHGERESVEIVDVAALGEGLRATWRGCVRVPPDLGIWPNAVAALPNGGMVLSGNNLAIWRPALGWKKIKAFHGVQPSAPWSTELGFANGVELSKDGRWIFLADTARGTISRFPLNGDAEPEVLKIDFSPGYFWPDNLHWGDDGALYLSGPYSTKKELPGDCYRRIVCDEIGIGIARIDTAHFTAKVIYRNPGMTGQFGAATTALELDGVFWVGTSVGDRIAIVKSQK